MSVTSQQDEGTPARMPRVTSRAIIIGWALLALPVAVLAISMAVQAETALDVAGALGVIWVARDLASKTMDASIRRGRELDRFEAWSNLRTSAGEQDS